MSTASAPDLIRLRTVMGSPAFSIRERIQAAERLTARELSPAVKVFQFRSGNSEAESAALIGFDAVTLALHGQAWVPYREDVKAAGGSIAGLAPRPPVPVTASRIGDAAVKFLRAVTMLPGMKVGDRDAAESALSRIIGDNADGDESARVGLVAVILGHLMPIEILEVAQAAHALHWRPTLEDIKAGCKHCPDLVPLIEAAARGKPASKTRVRELMKVEAQWRKEHQS